jgi:hypothetical protein
MDKEFKLVEGGGDDGDTLFIGYEPGRAVSEWLDNTGHCVLRELPRAATTLANELPAAGVQ